MSSHAHIRNTNGMPRCALAEDSLFQRPPGTVRGPPAGIPFQGQMGYAPPNMVGMMGGPGMMGRPGMMGGPMDSRGRPMGGPRGRMPQQPDMFAYGPGLGRPLEREAYRSPNAQGTQPQPMGYGPGMGSRAGPGMGMGMPMGMMDVGMMDMRPKQARTAEG